MFKKSVKGFTLVECLVALAILGIASLIMVQIYANVS
ncbi:MAG: type II secretion system protein J, partial [Oscillospiraceae bacterium]